MIHTIKVEADGFKEWQKLSFYDDEHDRVYLPAAVVGSNEMVVFFCASHDGVGMIRDGGHLYVPTDWMAKEYPDTAEVCRLVEERVRAAMKESSA